MNNQEIIKNLRSEKSNVILDTLQYISKEGNKDILDEVIKLLLTTSDTIIRDQIIKILENLRNQDCTPIVANAISNPENEEILAILVSSAWKSSLNFEDYVEIFTDTFIKSEFQPAFDALTVIDSFENLDLQKAEICIVKLNNAVEESKDDKQALFHELISIIKDKNKNPAE